jgi:hypothetical protein
MRVENAVLSEGSEWITCVGGANNDCHNYFAAEMLQRVEAKGEPPITPPAVQARVCVDERQILQVGWRPAYEG